MVAYSQRSYTIFSERPAHVGEGGGMLPLVVAHREHEEGLPGRHVHLRQEMAREKKDHGEPCHGRQGDSHEQDVRDQVGEDHGIDQAKSRSETGGEEEGEPGENLDAEEDPAQRA